MFYILAGTAELEIPSLAQGRVCVSRTVRGGRALTPRRLVRGLLRLFLSSRCGGQMPHSACWVLSFTLKLTRSW